MQILLSGICIESTNYAENNENFIEVVLILVGKYVFLCDKQAKNKKNEHLSRLLVVLTFVNRHPTAKLSAKTSNRL